MREPKGNLPFLRALRRESTLFALVGSLLLLLNLLQPLALAEPVQSSAWTICHGAGAQTDAGGAPHSPQRDCPICAAGLCAAASVSMKALPHAEQALAMRVAPARLFERPAARPAKGRRAGPPPPIRAPPFGI